MPRWLVILSGGVAMALGAGLIAVTVFLMAFGAFNAPPSSMSSGPEPVEIVAIVAGAVIILLGFACLFWGIFLKQR